MGCYKGPCHENGEIWSSALWDIFIKLGKRTADQLILEGHNQIQNAFKGHEPIALSKPTFSDGGLALLEADKFLNDIGLFTISNKAEICTALKTRGILKNC